MPENQDIQDYEVLPGLLGGRENGLYNYDLISLTQEYPVCCATVHFSLVWRNAAGAELRRFDVYPYNWETPVSYSVSEFDSRRNDLLSNRLQKVFVDKHNFFQELKAERISSTGGNTVTLSLLDPSGQILEEGVIHSYIQSISCKDISVNLELEYGWDHGEGQQSNLVGKGHSYILWEVGVQAEYWGATYHFQFIDNGSTVLNTKSEKWMGEAFANVSEGQSWNLPQAVTGFWRKMVEFQRDKQAISEFYLMRGGPPEMSCLSREAWTGTEWNQTQKKPNEWVPGSRNFLDWMINEFTIAEQTSGNGIDKRFRPVIYPSGAKITGNMSDWEVFSPENLGSDPTVDGLNNDWKAATEVFRASEGASENIPQSPSGGDSGSDVDIWQVPENAVIVMLQENKQTAISKALIEKQEAANNREIPQGSSSLNAIQAGIKIGKKYLWLSANKDVRSTVINFTMDTNAMIGWYYARHTPSQWPIDLASGEAIEEDKQNITPDQTEGSVTFQQEACARFDDIAAPMRDASRPNLATEGSTTSGESPPTALYLTEATSAFIGLQGTLEVLGDPDLEKVLYHGVQLDFDENAQVMLPWTKGTYLVTGLTDRIYNGLWTSSLVITKVGGLKRKASTPTDETSPLSELPTGDGGSTGSSDPPAPVPSVKIDGSDRSTTQGNASSIGRANENLAKESTTIDTKVPSQFLQSLFDTISGLSNLLKDTGRNAVGIGGVTPEMAVASGFNASEVATDKNKNIEASINWFYRCFNGGSWSKDELNQRLLCATMAYRFGPKVVEKARTKAQDEGKLTTRNYELLHPYILDEIQSAEYEHLGTDRREVASEFVRHVYTENYLEKYKGEALCLTTTPDKTGPEIVEEEDAAEPSVLQDQTPSLPKITGVINASTVEIQKPVRENYTPILFIQKREPGSKFTTSSGTFTVNADGKAWLWTGIQPALQTGDRLKVKVRNLTVTPPVDSNESAVLIVDLENLLESDF